MKYLIKAKFKNSKPIEFEIFKTDNDWVVSNEYKVDETVKQEAEVFISNVLAGSSYHHADFKFEILEEL